MRPPGKLICPAWSAQAVVADHHRHQDRRRGEGEVRIVEVGVEVVIAPRALTGRLRLGARRHVAARNLAVPKLPAPNLAASGRSSAPWRHASEALYQVIGA
jgi:hypothetical protein